VLRTHAHDELAFARRRSGEWQQLAACTEACPGRAAAHEVHRRRADETGDECRRRPVVDLVGRADLLDPAGVHDEHPLGECHRLDLVVRHEERRRAQRAVHLLDLEPRLPLAQLWRRVGERLVEETTAGLRRSPAPWRARPPSSRASSRGTAKLEDLRRLVGRPDLGERRFGDPEPVRHVVEHGHVRVERVVLEHHRDVALRRLHVVDDLAGDRDLARADLSRPQPSAAA
jgi:hypothetical protein